MFKPGQPKVAGRKKGTPNRASFEIQQACREHGPTVIGRLVQLAMGPDKPVALGAIKLILAYGYGRPRESVRVTSTETGPLEFTLGLGRPVPATLSKDEEIRVGN